MFLKEKNEIQSKFHLNQNHGPSNTDFRTKKEKFMHLMQAAAQTQKQLDGLNSRYQMGIGMGKTYYEAQLNKVNRKKD